MSDVPIIPATVTELPKHKRPKLYAALSWQDAYGGYWKLEGPRECLEDLKEYDADSNTLCIIEIPGKP